MNGDGDEAKADVEVIGQHIINGLQGLGQDLGKTLQNEMAGAVADHLVREYIEALQETRQGGGSVVTGEGLQSIESLQQGTGEYGIFMKAYLDQVDKGTTAEERRPVDMNLRLVEAADQYGMTPGELQGILISNGTEAYPFKRDARERTREAAPEIIGEKIAESIRENFEPKQKKHDMT